MHGLLEHIILFTKCRLPFHQKELLPPYPTTQNHLNPPFTSLSLSLHKNGPPCRSLSLSLSLNLLAIGLRLHGLYNLFLFLLLPPKFCINSWKTRTSGTESPTLHRKWVTSGSYELIGESNLRLWFN